MKCAICSAATEFNNNHVTQSSIAIGPQNNPEPKQMDSPIVQLRREIPDLLRIKLIHVLHISSSEMQHTHTDIVISDSWIMRCRIFHSRG